MSHQKNHLLVLVGGGHASGKDEVSNNLQKELQNLMTDVPSNKSFPIIIRRINLIDYDREIYDLTYTDEINQNSYKPTRFDFDQLLKDLKSDEYWEKLKRSGSGSENGPVDAADPSDHTISDSSSSVGTSTPIPPPIIAILTGTYALYDKRIRDMSIMKVYLDVDADTRLSRLILRDVKDDNSKLGSLLDTYLTRLRPEMTEYIAPTKQFADVILTKPCSAEGGSFGVQLIATGVYDRIKEEYYNAPDSNVPTLTLGKPTSEPPFRYRRESFVEQRESYYGLN